MGGDGVITHELSDRLAEDLMTNERFEALVSYLDQDEQYLSREWVNTLFTLKDQEIQEGETLLTPDIFAYAAVQSKRMKQLDHLGGWNLANMDERVLKGLFGKAIDMYYAHSGVHSMFHRRDRLEAGAEIVELNINRRERPDTFNVRQLANMYEELAFYDMLQGQVDDNIVKGQNLNQYVIETTPSWHHPYKIHSLFSLFDAESYVALAGRLRDGSSPRQTLNNAHLGLNRALEFISVQLTDYSKAAKEAISKLDGDELIVAERQMFGHLSMMSGALAEGLAQAAVQDYILDRGLHNRFWVRQAFLREDSMGVRRLANPKDETRETLDVPKMSFDLQLFDYTDTEYGRVPIEVKKRENPDPTTLHPDMKVITFKDSATSVNFAKYVRTYAQSQWIKHTGKRRTGTQKKVAREVGKRVNPGRLFPHE